MRRGRPRVLVTRRGDLAIGEVSHIDLDGTVFVHMDSDGAVLQFRADDIEYLDERPLWPKEAP